MESKEGGSIRYVLFVHFVLFCYVDILETNVTRYVVNENRFENANGLDQVRVCGQEFGMVSRCGSY